MIVVYITLFFGVISILFLLGMEFIFLRNRNSIIASLHISIDNADRLIIYCSKMVLITAICLVGAIAMTITNYFTKVPWFTAAPLLFVVVQNYFNQREKNKLTLEECTIITELED